MNRLSLDILDRVGNTSLLALRKIVPANGARILVKLKNENPTGSMKDRMALAMVETAEADGRLTADSPVVEYTAGSTGVSLSFVCAVKGHPLYIVGSDALHSDSGGMTEKLTRDMMEAARAISERTGAFSVGTAGSTRGNAESLRRRNPKIRVAIDGIGAGFVVPLWQQGIADRIERVSTGEATDMALRLAREEGLFAGTSTGANVVAALRSAEQLGPGASIVTVMCDTGMKYLKTFAPRLG